MLFLVVAGLVLSDSAFKPHPSSFLEEFPHSDLNKERRAELRKAFDEAAKNITVQTPTGWLAAAGFPADKAEKKTLTDLDTAEFDPPSKPRLKCGAMLTAVLQRCRAQR